MFFEDEKDILDNGADIQISEDGTVTWEDVLSDADEDLVSVKKSPAQKQKPKDIDLGDELELVEEDDDVDDAELAKILNETEASTTSTASYEESDEEFDIDSQLANAALEQNEAQAQGEVEIKPRKVEKKQSSSAMPFLLAILVALGVVGGLYYDFTMFAEDGGELSLNKDVPALATVQEQLNNITQEEIANRTKETEAQTQEAEKENIPVVNEENADEVKPEEKQPEEKKQVINVVPTGRPNPFMPIQKYVAVKIDDTVVDFDKVGIPKPPEEYGEPSGPVTKLMTIVVSGIMYDEQKPSAIITLDNNDYFVQEGDKLDDYKVLDIGKNFVVIALGKNTYKANIGEEFKVSSDFYGSAQYMPSNQGGGRQYQLIKETKATPLNQKTGRYVSESEV